jgi:hypothetical protein
MIDTHVLDRGSRGVGSLLDQQLEGERRRRRRGPGEAEASAPCPSSLRFGYAPALSKITHANSVAVVVAHIAVHDWAP